MNRFFLIAGLTLLTLIYALCFTAIKSGLPFVPPLLFGALRAFIGGAALLVFLLATRQRILPKPEEYLWIIAIGLVATTIVYAGMFLSPERMEVGIASVLGNLSPLFAVALAAVVLHEKIGAYAKAALGMGVFGISLISFPDLVSGSFYGATGIFLALAASIGSAAGNVMVKKMGTMGPILVLTSWQLIIGSLPLFLLSAFFEQSQLPIWNATSLGLLFFMGIIGTAIATAAWFWLIQRYDVGKISLFLFLIPVFGLLIAAVVFKEQIQLNEILGIASILFGTLLLAIDTYRTHPASLLKTT